ncbi:hypothetical protein RN001_014398 [Aquatica leii]|uniref:Uncharacterized protein n=1 Tax=Aquatica leii TaxID=1421715 RepID=A0AAN7SBK7_9COLE|nr:hypothetical protein RN001_014398 [Aquatica leii]
MSLRKSRNVDAAKLVKDIAEGSRTTATRYRDSLTAKREKPFTKDEALSLLIEGRLSKNMYNTIRAAGISHNCSLFPSYKNVLDAKKDCYPPAVDIRITETCAEVKLQALLDHTNLQFGISSLHAWIRFFECLLHISYRLDVKKWQSRGEDKVKVESRKKNVQKGFRQKLGLLVDMPKQGYGSTNDGNTARRFFENAEISAGITALDLSLIKRIHVMLQVLSCGFDIDIPMYEAYCIETARLYAQLYPWFCMPTTVHKILLHSSKILESSILPIGQMSEEAQESCNKFIKQYRQDFARKCSRTKTMEDVFQRLLVASDPVISSIQKLPLLKTPSCEAQSSDDDSAHSTDDEY